jgi:hypothetical protein
MRGWTEPRGGPDVIGKRKILLPCLESKIWYINTPNPQPTISREFLWPFTKSARNKHPFSYHVSENVGKNMPKFGTSSKAR